MGFVTETASIVSTATRFNIFAGPTPARARVIYSRRALLRGARRSLLREARYSRRLEEEVNARTRELAGRSAELERLSTRLE